MMMKVLKTSRGLPSRVRSNVNSRDCPRQRFNNHESSGLKPSSTRHTGIPGQRKNPSTNENHSHDNVAEDVCSSDIGPLNDRCGSLGFGESANQHGLDRRSRLGRSLGTPDRERAPPKKSFGPVSVTGCPRRGFFVPAP